MKSTFRKYQRFIPTLFLACLAALVVLVSGGQSTYAQQGKSRQPDAPIGTGFTYQGQLKDGGNPANGQYDLQFKLFDAASGGVQVGSTVTVANQTVTGGLFTVVLDFGASAFSGQARWLEIAVRPTGGGTYTTLSPRQPLTAVPYAQSLATGSSGAVITGTLPGPSLIVTNTSGTGIQGASFGSYGLSGISTDGTGIYGQGSLGNGTGVYGYGNIGIDGKSDSNIGVLGTSPYRGVWGRSSSGTGVYGEGSTGVYASGSNYGVRGLGTGNGYGGYFETSSNLVAGVSGRNYGTNGIGVYGEAASGTSAYGVWGYSTTGIGVNATNGNGSNYGVRGQGGTGVYGITSVSNGVGVRGDSSGGYGVHGVSTNNGTGVRGESVGGSGVRGQSTNSTGVTGSGVIGVEGVGNAGSGVYGFSTGSLGVHGETSNASSWGVQGNSSNGGGVAGISTSNTGVYGISSTGYAGWFDGNVNVTGGCCAAAEGTFKIDHPLDPENKYLVQSAVQSADMASIYSGNATTNAKGEVVVTLPSYIEALNKDFRYQLTVMGQFAQAIVAEEMKDNHFTIKTDKPNVKVSWQVTGIRKDPYAKAHPIVPEVDKPADEQGLYRHPVEYGQPESKGTEFEKIQQMKSSQKSKPSPATPGR
jgi:hypothetical protein